MDARKRTLRLVAKHSCYVLALLLAYVLQTMPGFLSFFGVKPVFLVPLALCIAAYEGAFAGAVYGALAGLLWDVAAGRVTGFFAILLMACCFFAAVAVTLYLRNTILNLSLLSAGVLLLLCTIDFAFSYLLRGYAGLAHLYSFKLLPIVVFSAFLTFAPWLLARKIFKAFIPPD